jgi:FkbM family methyltransferase
VTGRRHLLRLLQGAAQRAGLHVIPRWRRRNEAFAAHLSRLFALLGVDCVLDVGANEGQYRNFIRREVDFQGWVVSYEPIPDLASMLQAAAKADAHWIVHPEAVGVDSSPRLFSVMANREFSSFLRPDVSHFGALTSSNTVERQIEVRTSTLAQVIEAAEQTTASQRLYLKLDTQGYDLSILKAGQSVLSAVPALQTEASVKRLYEHMPGFAEVFDWLDAAGFNLSGVFPNNEGHFPMLVEFDAVFVNRRFLPEGQERP